MASSTTSDRKQCVIPGQRLGHVDSYVAGPGTYIRRQHIYASVVGFKMFEGTENESSDDVKPVIIVTKEKEPAIIPQINSIVTAKVVRTAPRLASVIILCVGSKPLKEPFQGVIRVQDVRETEVDKVQIYKSFRPGDIVRAQVISLGDARSYYLSTARNDLGVVFAQSVAGATMIPISWELMQCPKTKMKEYRKVARPDNISIETKT